MPRGGLPASVAGGWLLFLGVEDDDDDRDVVPSAGLDRRRDQGLSCLLWVVGAREEPADVIGVELVGQPVGSDEEALAGVWR
jgi:hypothetical protein